MKKVLTIVLTVALLLSLMVGVVSAEESMFLEAQDFEVEYLAAPAVAGLLLEAAGVDNRFGKGKDGGNYISLVAEQMGPGTDFNGVPKSSVGAYQFEVAKFLNNLNAGVEYIPNNELIQTLTINSNSINGINSEILENDVCYRFEISGTWQNTNHQIDAEYLTFDAWGNYQDGTPTYGANQKDLQVNGQFVDWGDYNPDHVYYLGYTGNGSVVNFRVFDGYAYSNIPDPSWYNDNNGTLTIKIYKTSW